MGPSFFCCCFAFFHGERSIGCALWKRTSTSLWSSVMQRLEGWKNVCLIAHLWGIMLCEVPYVHPFRVIEVHKHVQGRWALQTSLQILYKHTYAWLLLNLQSQATSFAVLKHV